MDASNQENEIFLVLSQAGPGSAVKALLTLRNISQTDLSQKLGITTSEISRVISGKRKTRRIRRAIAEELGVPVDVLFRSLDSKAAEALETPELATGLELRD